MLCGEGLTDLFVSPSPGFVDKCTFKIELIFYFFVLFSSTILKTKVAAEVSIRIMDAFVAMRHYISGNLIEQKYINNMVLEDNRRINKNTVDIKLLQELFDRLETAKGINHVYFNDKVY